MTGVLLALAGLLLIPLPAALVWRVGAQALGRTGL